MNTSQPENMKPAHPHTSSEASPGNIQKTHARPVKLYPLVIIFFIIGAMMFPVFLGMTICSTRRSMEIYTVQIEKMTDQEKKTYNNGEYHQIDFYEKIRPEPQNYIPLANMAYPKIIKNGKIITYAFRGYIKKFTFSEKLDNIPVTFFLIFFTGVLIFSIYICCVFSRYNKTLLILAKRKIDNFPGLPSLEPLSIPVLNLLWIFPVSLKASHYGQAISKLYNKPYTGPTKTRSLFFSLLMLSTPYWGIVTNGWLYVLFLFVAYYYMKKLNTFITDMAPLETLPEN